MMTKNQQIDDLTLEHFDHSLRWVAWREELRRNADGVRRKTKIPHNPTRNGHARSTDPSTWGTREQAEQTWDRLDDRHSPGGVGLILGELDDGSFLSGIDLDGCLDRKTENIKSWACEVLDRFDTYAEVSPSRKGIKLFFLIAPDDADAVARLFERNDKGERKSRKAFVVDDHCEMAIDRSARYYAVTGQRLEEWPESLRTVSVADVRWFFEQAGPDFLRLHNVGSDDDSEAGLARDESGSGHGYRFMGNRKKDGLTYQQARERILEDQGKAGEWANRVDERQLRRAWDRSGDADDRDRDQTHHWDDPDVSLLDDRRGQLPGFPLRTISSRWLRDWLKDAAHGTGTTVDHVALPLIGIASTMIGTSRRVMATKSFTQPCTLWTMVIAQSGSGKTPGIDATRNALAALESDREVDNRHLKREHDQRVQHAEAAFKRWQKQVTEAVAGGRPPPSKPEEADRPGEYIEPKLYTTDVTIERMAQLLQARPQGMLLLTDELAGWFKNMSRYSGGSDDQFWLMAWDGKPYSVERKGSPAIKLDHLLIGVVGGIQPDRFAEVLKGPSDGMTARFLFAWPGEISYQPLRDTISETDRNIHALLNKLSNLPERDFNRLRLSQEARDEFERVRKEVFAKISLLDGREREWWSKIPAQCLRLAGVLIYLEWAVPDGGGPEPEVIKRRFIVDAADLLFDHFWPHAQAALRQIELSERHGDARRILRWIVAQRCEEISREEVRRKALRRNRDADQTTAILNKLVRAGWLRSIEPEENPVGGRPKLRWGVNPKLFEIE